MALLPVVGRELRVSSRKVATYWSRTGTAFLALVVVAWMWSVMHATGARGLGSELFQMLVGIAFMIALAAGVAHTSDAVCEEKREGTLGLLFLTDLKGYDIVLGKLAVTSLRGFFNLVAMIPVIAIPILLGGVSGSEFSRSMLVVFNTLFLSLSIGLFFSVFSNKARSASGWTIFVLVLCCLGLPIYMSIYQLNGPTRAEGWGQLVVGLNPALLLGLTSDSTFARSPNLFWRGLQIQHGVSWLLLGIASFAIGRVWQDKPATSFKQRVTNLWRFWSQGDRGLRDSERSRLLDRNPILWLSAGRERLRSNSIWAVLGVLFCFWIWGAIQFKENWFDPGVYFMTAFLLTSMIKGWVGSESVRRFHEDRRSGALELILSTPITLQSIFRGQCLGLQKIFLGPVMLILIVDVVFMISGMAEMSRSQDRIEWFFMFFSAIVVAIADFITMAWLGMWIGLTTRKSNQAAGGVLSRVMAAPWVFYLCFLMLLALPAFREAVPDTALFFTGLWLMISLGVDLYLFTWSRRQLHSRFRFLAHRPLGSEDASGLWAVVGRLFGRR